MRYIPVIFLFVLFARTGPAATIYVPDDYGSIQDAIDQSQDGDTIVVRPGTYVENIDYSGRVIHVQSEQGPEVTVIDGNQMGSVVACQNDEAFGAVLEGFTITNGSGTLTESGLVGGGIYCTDEAALIVRRNIIVGNTARHGGGLFTMWRLELHENVISGNTAHQGEGGGLFAVYAGNLNIKNNRFVENSASYGGGAIGLYGNSYGLIANNVIADNQVSSGEGGGIMLEIDCVATIENNSIHGNHGYYKGGGIEVYDNSQAYIANNTLSGNSSVSGGGISCRRHSIIEVRNTILWNNTASYKGPEMFISSPNYPSECSISHSDVDGGQSSISVGNNCTLNWGDGMMDADPLFADPLDNDFHLTFPSPCKDAGDSSAVQGLEDFEGDPRHMYGSVDMGADEFCTHLYWTGDASPGGGSALKIVGLPGTTPVYLWLGSGVLDPPWSTKYGDWHLQYPLIANVALGAVPSNGILVVPFTFPSTTPTPLSLPFQAGVGMELTNLSAIVVQ